MSVAALLAARTQLMADAALTAFFSDRYGKTAKHPVGYRRPVNANDFPVLCYVPVMAQRPDSIGGMNQERVSIVIGLHEPGITEEVFDGVIYTEMAAGLVFACLESGQLGGGALYLGEGKIVTDMGARHPIYEIELSMLLGVR